MLCPQGHRFDIARQGYVNLLPVQNKRSLHPGDTKEQVLARRAFLEAGFYTPIVETLCRLSENGKGPVLDVGCGEGYYSTRLAKAMGASLVGLDISKEAVRFAAGQYKNAQWLCASAARLPLADSSFGLVTSLFSLTAAEEFSRVLMPEGTYILLHIIYIFIFCNCLMFNWLIHTFNCYTLVCYMFGLPWWL